MMSNFTTALEERFVKQVEYLGKNKPVNNIEPVVSVTVATYQHAPYIKECLEGILMQKTDFPFEIIIGEDESTDGTREICIEYANKYPDKIRLFLRDRKQSQYYDETGKFIGRFNGHWNRMSARGKYIAWCEGDDYWIDPLKLQKQVEFLEQNNEYGLVHTNFKINNITKNTSSLNNIKLSIGDSLDEYLLGKFHIATLTVCFRSIFLNRIDYSYLSENFGIGDYPIWVQILNQSKVKFLSDITANYSILEESASHSKDVIKRVEYQINIRNVRLYFANKLNKSYLIKYIERDQYYYFSKLLFMQKKYFKSFLYLIRCRNPFILHTWLRFVISRK